MESVTQGPRGIHRRIAFEITESLRLRLEAGIERRGPDDCWLWTGAPRNGYGCIKHNGKVLGTHVVAFVIANGPVPDGHLVTHDCDTRLCCNPRHLKAGTATSNVVEMYDRRRVKSPRGRAAYNAKLNEKLVQLIHALRSTGLSRYRIAKLVGHANGTVKTVIENRSWKHVPKPTADEAKSLIEEFNARCPQIAEPRRA